MKYERSWLRIGPLEPRRIVPSSESGSLRTSPSLVAAAIGLFMATLAWRFLTFTGFTNDHYAHVALAQQMLLGDRPIRDFADPGWPLTYLLSAASWLVAGDTLGAEWAITAGGFALGAACTVAAAHRLTGSISIAILVTILEILIYPRTYSYPKVLAYAAGAWLIILLAAKPSLRRVTLMSAAIAVAFLLRHDHGLFLGLAAAVCVAFASRGDGWPTVARRVAALTAATAAFLLPWILFVVFNGGLVAYLQTGMEFSRVEFEAFRLRSWPTLRLVPGEALFGMTRPIRPLAQVEWSPDVDDAARTSLERRYGLEYVRESDGTRFYYAHNPTADNMRALADDPLVAGSSNLGRVSRPAWRELLATLSPLRLAPALQSSANADVWLFWLFWSLPPLCALCAWRHALRRQERWAGECAGILGLVVLGTLVNATFLREALRARVPDAIVPAVLLGAWALSLCWTGRWSRRILQSGVRGVTLVVLLVTTAAIADVSELPEQISRAGIEDGVAGVRASARAATQLLRRSHRDSPASRYGQALMPFYRYLDRCTSSSDRLVVTGYFPDILVAAGRRFAGEGINFGDWSSSEASQERAIERLRSRPALFALHVSADVEFSVNFPLIDAYLRQAYVPLAEIPAEGAGSIFVLVLKSRSSVQVDSATGWPCFR
jgi:hypothetical protein